MSMQHTGTIGTPVRRRPAFVTWFALGILLLANSALADFTAIDITPQANIHLQDYPTGAGFGGIVLPQEFTGSHTYFGIPFQIAASGPNGWNGYNAVGPNPHILTLTTSIAHPSAVYTLMNTYWGSAGNYTTVECEAADGTVFQKQLYTGMDIRDYTNGSWVNTINNTTTKQVIAYVVDGLDRRVDMQRIDLPPSFSASTLVRVSIIDFGQPGVQQTVVAGITVDNRPPIQVPVPTGDIRPQVPPLQPTIGTTGLVLVVHGWTPNGPTDVTDMQNLANAIRARIATDGRTAQWDVRFVDWSASGATTFPWPEVENARLLGLSILPQIPAQYTTFHIVGHSLGAWVVDELSWRLKAARPSVQIHQTYLDGYVPIRIPGFQDSDFETKASQWGRGAASVEQYYNETLYRRDNSLESLQDWLVGLASRYQIPSSPPANCKLDSIQIAEGDIGDEHGYSIRWYTRTVTNNNWPLSKGRGYARSPEGAGTSSVPLSACDTPATLDQIIQSIQTLGLSSTAGVSASGSGSSSANSTGTTLNTSSFYSISQPVSFSSDVDNGRVAYQFASAGRATVGVWLDGVPVHLGSSDTFVAPTSQDVFQLASPLSSGNHVLGLSIESLEGSPVSVTFQQMSVGSFACPVVAQSPVAQRSCISGLAQFAVIANASAPLSYQWQLQTGPNTWINLANIPAPLPCGGTATAFATPLNSPTVTIGVHPCTGSVTAPQHFQVRCLVSNACGSVTSNEAAYTICLADFDCNGSLAVADIFSFLNAWFAGSPTADFDGVNGLQVADIFTFLNAWFSGC